MKSVKIAAGAGFSNDRIDPAVEVAEKGNVKYIIFECLAERTIAIAQLEKNKDPLKGYGTMLEERMEAILPFCAEKNLVMISDLGAANPGAAFQKSMEIAESIHAKPVKIAAVTGDDVLEKIIDTREIVWETGAPVSDLKDKIVSANAYLGIEAILPALQAGATVIITGRAADPSLALAPLAFEFGWDLSDWHRLGAGTAVGHLLECAAQVTGGFFADPGYKDVADLSNLGFPIAEVFEDGRCIISKTPGSGGEVSIRTCKEQILYEIGDPSTYLTPDVTADFSRVTMSQIGPDQVMVENATGKPRPEKLKVSLGVEDGFMGEGEISYAGPNALQRAKLAESVILHRLKKRKLHSKQLKTECIGYSAILGQLAERFAPEPFEARLRVAAKVDTEKEAKIVGDEVESLYLNGPAGPAGARKYSRPVIAVYSTTIPRHVINISMHINEVR
jgi:hypothetical protein